MKKKIVFLLLGIQLLSCSLFAQDLFRKLDTLLTVYASQFKFSGSVLVAKDGKVILEKGYGLKDAVRKTLNDANSIFQIGSITKGFTSAIILYLQEQGKLDVQDKLSKYIPDYPKGDKITLRNLLSHTSGIYNYTNDSRFMNNDAIKHIDLEKAIELFKEKPLDFEPGTKFSYSNSGYILLGYIIQKVSGRSYEQMVREVIFRPLHMDHSGFDFKNLKDSNKVTGYFILDSNRRMPAPIIDSSASFSAGAIYSTVGDLYKWHKGLLTNAIISQASLEKAYTRFKGTYGYGWFVDSIKGKRLLTHNGAIFGFTSDLLRVPADDVCIVVLCNKPANLTPISRNLLNILYDLPYETPRERKEIKLAENVLQQYVGEYWISEDFKVYITLENGQLKGQLTGQPRVDLFAQKENLFFLKLVDAQVEFVKDASGKIDKLILYQGGAMLEGKKVK